MIGVFLSWRLKNIASTWAVCHFGGSRIAQGLFRLAKHRDASLQETLGLCLAAMGFYHHMRFMNRPPIPLSIHIFLTPMTLLETLLRSLTLAKASNVA